MVLRFLAGFLLLLPAAALGEIRPEQLRRHIDILASDSFEGRAPGRPGETKKTDHIVAQWRAFGLEPAGEQGVPAVIVGGSFSDMAKLNAFRSGSYHKAADNLVPEVELGGAAEDATLLVTLGRELGDPVLYARSADAPDRHPNRERK
jgi:hypothetical protein